MSRTLFAALATVLFGIATPALATDFPANADGQIAFGTPTGNIGCVYTPAGGTAVYQPVGGGPELQCDRVHPTYQRVILGPHGAAKKYVNVGAASCCGGDPALAYGSTWAKGGFSCLSTVKGLVCSRGSHGFKISKKGISAY